MGNRKSNSSNDVIEIFHYVEWIHVAYRCEMARIILRNGRRRGARMGKKRREREGEKARERMLRHAGSSSTMRRLATRRQSPLRFKIRSEL